MQFSRRQVLLGASALAASQIPHAALAQSYPSKPITIVVSYPPGGDTDAIARAIGEKLAQRVGQPVIVENKPGASGAIGNAHVANAAPDGYTLLLTPGTFASAPVVLRSGTKYDAVNGVTSIIETGYVSLFLVTTDSTGFKSVKDVVAAAKAGRQLSYGSPGNGSPMHFVGEMLNRAAGIGILHTPYKGVGPSVTDVIGGHIPLAWVPYGPVKAHIESGKLRVLAVAEPERSQLLPNVPSLAEFGYRGIDPMSWQGLLGPKGMSAELVKFLNGHVNEILKDPDVRQRMANLGTVAIGGTPERLEKAKADGYNHYAKLVKELGIQAD